jgi:hypothetical protein
LGDGVSGSRHCIVVANGNVFWEERNGHSAPIYMQYDASKCVQLRLTQESPLSVMIDHQPSIKY